MREEEWVQSPLEVLCKVKDAEQIQRRAAAIFLYLKASKYVASILYPLNLAVSGEHSGGSVC